MQITGAISLDDETPALSNVEEAKEIRTFETKGRGRKQCGECGIYIGVRTKVCKCGFVFARKKKAEKVKSTVRRTKRVGVNPPAEKKKPVTGITGGGRCIIQAPAGKCPFDLADTEFDTVKEWAGKIRAWGEPKGDFYTVNAIKYYARYYFGVFTDEYKTVAKHLETIYADELVVEETTEE